MLPSRHLRAPRAASRHAKHPGVLKPGEALTIDLQAELLDHEQPVVFTPKPGQVTVRAAAGRQVTIQNETESPVFFVMLIVPSKLVKLALVDWGHVLSETRRGLAAIPWFQRLFSRPAGR